MYEMPRLVLKISQKPRQEQALRKSRRSPASTNAPPVKIQHSDTKSKTIMDTQSNLATSASLIDSGNHGNGSLSYDKPHRSLHPPTSRRPQKQETPFIEPDLAVPAPTYTGFPLEQLPPSKVKKDSLWPVRKSSGLFIPTNSSHMNPGDAETDYHCMLKTPMSENITRESNIRHKQPRKLTLHLPATPQQRTLRASNSPRPRANGKRIKVIASPKKTWGASLVAHPESLSPKVLVAVTSIVNDDVIDNDDFCSRCGMPGTFICCETCPRLFHFMCCSPPFEEPPLGDWHCRACTAKSAVNKSKSEDIGIFQPLVNLLEATNPLEFGLPRPLQMETFIGVAPDSLGDYSDGSAKSSARTATSQMPGYNKCVDLDVDLLYRKDGSPYLCYKCGQSGLARRHTDPLAHCDYCSLVWHVDCLPEVVASPKTMGSRWKCPNHVDDLTNIKSHRRFKNSVVIDAALHNQFTRNLSMSSTIISSNDLPNLHNSPRPSLAMYLAREHEENSQVHATMDYTNLNNTESNMHHTLALCEFTPSGVKARVSCSFSELLEKCDPYVFRVPQKLVLVDFIHRAQKEQSIRQSIVTQKHKALLEIDQDTQVAKSLLAMSQEKGLEDYDMAKGIDYEELVNVAAYTKNVDVAMYKENFTAQELYDLVKVKQLMDIKGKEAMLNFLKFNAM